MNTRCVRSVLAELAEYFLDAEMSLLPVQMRVCSQFQAGWLDKAPTSPDTRKMKWVAVLSVAFWALAGAVKQQRPPPSAIPQEEPLASPLTPGTASEFQGQDRTNSLPAAHGWWFYALCVTAAMTLVLGLGMFYFQVSRDAEQLLKKRFAAANAEGTCAPTRCQDTLPYGVPHPRESSIAKSLFDHTQAYRDVELLDFVCGADVHPSQQHGSPEFPPIRFTATVALNAIWLNLPRVSFCQGKDEGQLREQWVDESTADHDRPMRNWAQLGHFVEQRRIFEALEEGEVVEDSEIDEEQPLGIDTQSQEEELPEAKAEVDSASAETEDEDGEVSEKEQAPDERQTEKDKDDGEVKDEQTLGKDPKSWTAFCDLVHDTESEEDEEQAVENTDLVAPKEACSDTSAAVSDEDEDN
eukprot:s838_g11.t1